MENNAPYFDESVELLKDLIRTPSFSREEYGTATLIENFLVKYDANPRRLKNNVYAFSDNFDLSRPAILLNSHHDTVKPNADWTKNPFLPEIADGNLYGLGSNDAGGALVSLLSAFLHLRKADLPFNLIYAATAEEENAGSGGIELLLPELGLIDCAVVGEPTSMQTAVAERGLMVLDCTVYGRSGHAARNVGINAIERALPALQWFASYQFPKISPLLGSVKMTVTQISAGTQHNVIPARCSFVTDIRLNDCYTHQELFDIIAASCGCEISARSMRLKPSSISNEHPLAVASRRLGIPTFASPTMSDQALLTMPSIKIGPGDSARSHTADEFISLQEISEGISCYISLLQELAAIYETLGQRRHD
ncbi:M20 family metallo-hydrolase [Ignavibacteria bacterium]|nr:M20 family metallo-hydrolase [Bacteroidota bacterium]MCZ2133233.1 M20 family metallo-hydrolase [Bacteroidota bacterium]